MPFKSFGASCKRLTRFQNLVMFNDAQKGSNMTTDTKAKPAPITLPAVGMSRWEQLRHFIPVSRETWRQLVIAGRAPKPVRLAFQTRPLARANTGYARICRLLSRRTLMLA